MEQLSQKYSRWFYVVLICLTSIQLLDIISTTLKGETPIEMFTLMFLSVINLVLLLDSIRRNKKQQFTQGKSNMKLLRVTIAIRMIFYALLCFRITSDFVVLGEHFAMVAAIELMLSYRISNIERLENMVKDYIKNNTLNS